MPLDLAVTAVSLLNDCRAAQQEDLLHSVKTNMALHKMEAAESRQRCARAKLPHAGWLLLLTRSARYTTPVLHT